jgi:5-formyltetrahydrofolate cyclo-ligase
MTKESARIWAKAQLTSLWGQQTLRESQSLLWQQLFMQPCYIKSKIVLAYVSLPLEVPSLNGISQVLAHGKRLFLPAIRHNIMDFEEVRTLDGLVAHDKLAFLQPALPQIEPVSLPPPHHPTLLVAPCLLANSLGFRLGYGGGYYDRYLATSKQNYLTTCLFCLEDMYQNIFDGEDHDQPFDFTVTEKAVYWHSAKHSLCK